MLVWTIGDLFGLIGAVIVLAVIAVIAAIKSFREWRCKHDGYVTETTSCDAICGKCGKNLGFIGTW